MKIGRNELCPCGSGKKYKKSCLNNETKQVIAKINKLYASLKRVNNEL